MPQPENENETVGKSLAKGFGQGVQQSVVGKPRKKLRAPTADEISMGGRIIAEATRGAGVGAQVGRGIPRVGAGLGAAGGAVIGAGKGVVNEANRVVASRATEPEKAGSDGALMNSQAGLQAAHGRSMSSPPPGELGSRYNPVVRERQDRGMNQAQPAAGLIDSVPGMPQRSGPPSQIDVEALLATDEPVVQRLKDYQPSIPIDYPEAESGSEYGY